MDSEHGGWHRVLDGSTQHAPTYETQICVPGQSPSVSHARSSWEGLPHPVCMPDGEQNVVHAVPSQSACVRHSGPSTVGGGS
jgi:hypothetical protein